MPRNPFPKVNELVLLHVDLNGSEKSRKAIAAKTGVDIATVSRWLSAGHNIDPKYWTPIEKALRLPEGTIAEVAFPQAFRGRFKRIEGSIEALRQRVAVLEGGQGGEVVPLRPDASPGSGGVPIAADSLEPDQPKGLSRKATPPAEQDDT